MRNESIARASSSANRLMSPSENSTNQLNRTNCNGNNENYCFNETMSSSSSSPTNACLFQTNNSSNNEMPALQNVNSDHIVVLSNDISNQLPELSSLNNEFLNTILTPPNYQQSSSNSSTNIHSLSQHETNFVHNIDEESGRTSTTTVAGFDESRPRQLGRRSEMRSRIVSITAERSAEGNQVNTLSLFSNKITNTYPMKNNYNQFHNWVKYRTLDIFHARFPFFFASYIFKTVCFFLSISIWPLIEDNC